MTTVHIVGAGLAGLAAATLLCEQGRAVVLYEAAGQAGGRCRSYHDAGLDRLIDNGNHLILGGNRAVFRYLDRIGSRDRLVTGADIAFPFVDLRSGARWTLRPNAGRLPWWMLSPGRRVPGSRFRDYLAALALLRAGPADRVTDRLDPATALFEKLWAPLAIAALNIDPARGSARLMAAVMAGTFLRGGAACRPHVAGPDGLSGAFVDPALAWLRARGGTLHLHHRLRRLILDGSRAAGLDFGTTTVSLDPGDTLILALPPASLGALLPGQPVPAGSTAILNLHFRLDRPAALPDHAPLLGVIGGTAEWLFSRDDTVSVTVSAADRLIDRPAGDLAARIWPEVARALDLNGPQPPSRVVKEKRATFLQTPDAVACRPGTRTRWDNILLAGDWTDTGLPATIEGAIRSGHEAGQAGLCPGPRRGSRTP